MAARVVPPVDGRPVAVLRSLLHSLGLGEGDSFDSLSHLGERIDECRDAADRHALQCEERLREDVCNNELAAASRQATRHAQVAYFAGEVLRLLHCVNDRLLQKCCPPEGKFCELVVPYQQPCPEDGEDGVKLTKYQQLLLHVLKYVWRCGYRKMGGSVYERVYRGGKPIGAWRKVCSLEEVVYRAAKKGDRFDQWCNLTAGAGNAAAAAQYLNNGDDPELPALKTDRHLFAFSNGVYVTGEDAYFPHDDVPDRYTDTAAAKYFDAELDAAALDARDWRGIDTPSFQSILAHQGMDGAGGVDEWMYIMIGRLLYELGEKDNWQVIPFLKGMAATGKSTILLNVCRHLFAEDDVGVLSNNIEKKFGLWGFVTKKIFIAPEVKSDLHLDQAEFQSLVSGDAIQVAQKHMQSQTVNWRVPGILAGNEVPGWKDSAGSITRRILLFHFAQPVTQVDTRLGDKLQAELPRLLVKCNRAYLEAVRLVGPASIWDAVPQYFRDRQRDLQACVDNLWEFLNCGELHFGEGLYMPWDVFHTKYKEWCKARNVDAVDLGKKNEDAYVRTLASLKCVKEKQASKRFWPPGSFLPADNRLTVYLTGVDEARG